MSEYILQSRTGTNQVTAALISVHLRLDPGTLSIPGESDYIDSLINCALEAAESLTNRIMVAAEYIGYFDCFYDSRLIKRAPLNSISKIEYLIDDTWTEVDTDVYGFTVSNSYSTLYLKSGKSWPSTDSVPQPIKIYFNAGYTTNIDSELVQAQKLHVGHLYANRGDVETNSGSQVENDLTSTVPAEAKRIYRSNRIANTLSR